MDEKLHILQHSLGLDSNGQGRAYRNHFVTSEGTTDWPHCQALVADGLMVKYAPSAFTGNSPWFGVTEAGRAYVAAHSPKPPKMTAAQRRYREWARADNGMTFGEWLKARRDACAA